MFTGDKKGTATVSWSYKVKDSGSGYKGLKVEINSGRAAAEPCGAPDRGGDKWL